MEGEFSEVRQWINCLTIRWLSSCHHWKGSSVSVMCHVHSISLILSNLHKNPAKPITALHLMVPEIWGKKGSKKGKDEMTLPYVSQVWFFKSQITMNRCSFLPYFQLLVFSCEFFSGSSCWRKPWIRDDYCFGKWMNSQTGLALRGDTPTERCRGYLHTIVPLRLVILVD